MTSEQPFFPAAAFMKKAPVPARAQRANSFAVPPQFYCRTGSLRILSYPSRCNGRTRRSYFPQAGLGLPLRRVIRKDHLTASHRPAALCTGEQSSYWVSFIAPQSYYAPFPASRGEQGKNNQNDMPGETEIYITLSRSAQKRDPPRSGPEKKQISFQY